MEQTLSQPWKMSSGYLLDSLYDNIFIFGVLFLALASGLIVLWDPQLFLPVLFADLWFLGYHHVLSTFTKLAGTRQDREENRFLIFGLPLIVLASVFAVHQAFGGWTIVTIYFFWQWYHYTRQAYGISSFYRRKARNKSETPASLDIAALWSIPIWGIVYRCAQGWDTFIFQPLWVPDIPIWMSNIVGVIACSVLLVWLATKVMDWSKGQLSFAPFYFIISHHMIFFAGYILIKDITIGWLVANIWHNAQYILFVWLFNQMRFKDQNTRNTSPFLHWLCQKGPYRTIAYFAFFICATSIIYNSLNAGVELISGSDAAAFTALSIIIFQTINFHHYIVDSQIWKARKKTHQKIMKITEN